MAFLNFKETYYSEGETCAGHIMPNMFYFLKTYEFTPKRSILSSKLESEGREFYCIEVNDINSGYKKIISFYRDGENTEIVFKDFDKWAYIPKRYRNNSIPSFCLPVKIWTGKSYDYRLYSFPYDRHRYLGDVNGTYKLTSEAVAVLFAYVKNSFSIVDILRNTVTQIENIFNISCSRISENEYKAMLI